MQEPDPKHIRQLERLQGRVERISGEREKLAAARRVLQTELRDRQQALKSAETELAEQRRIADGVVAENKRLAEQIEALEAAASAATTAAERAVANAAKATSAIDGLRRELLEATDRLRRAEATARTATERAAIAEAQVRGEGLPSILPASDVADLVQRLFESFGSLGELSVRDSELKLNLSIAGEGRQTGFVVPTAAASTEAPESVHSVTIRFDRTAQKGGIDS